jgi:hypothetical protein
LRGRVDNSRQPAAVGNQENGDVEGGSLTEPRGRNSKTRWWGKIRSTNIEIRNKSEFRNPKEAETPSPPMAGNSIPIHCVSRFAALFGICDIRDAAGDKGRQIRNKQKALIIETQIPLQFPLRFPLSRFATLFGLFGTRDSVRVSRNPSCFFKSAPHADSANDGRS